MSTLIRSIFAVLIVLSSVGTIAAPTLAKEAKTRQYTSQLTGSVLEIGAPPGSSFTVEPPAMYRQPDHQEEAFTFWIDGATFTVSFYDGDYSADDWHKMTMIPTKSSDLDYTDILGSEVDSDSAWTFVRRTRAASFQDFMYGEYYQDLGNGSKVGIFTISREPVLMETLAWMESSITVDGEHVFANIDLANVQAMADGTSDIVPERIWRFASTAEDWTGMGLVSETEWQVPGYDVVVTWNDANLAVPFYRDDALGDLPYIFLHSTSPTGQNRLMFEDSPENSSGTPLLEQLEAELTSEEYATKRGYHYPPAGSFIQGNALTVIHSTTNGIGEVAVYVFTIWEVSPGVLAKAVNLNTPELIPGAYTTFMSSVDINGEAPPVLWTEAELQKIFPSDVDETADVAETEATSEATTEAPRRTRRSAQLPGTADATAEATTESRQPRRTSRTTASSQQSSSTLSKTSVLSGATIEIDTTTGASFQPNRSGMLRTQGDRVELVTFWAGVTTIQIEFFEGSVDPQEAIDSWISGQSSRIEWLGGEVNSGDAWALYSQSHYLDYRMMSYVQVDTTTVEGFTILIAINSSQESSQDDLKWASQGIAIDGVPLLASIDHQLLADVAAGESDYVPVDVTLRHTTVDDWEDEGLVSESEWSGPLSNTSFTWDTDLWQVVWNRPDAIVINPDRNDEALILETPDRLGMTKLRVWQTDDTPEEWIEWWLSDEYRAADPGFVFTVIDSAVTDETGSVVLLFHTVYGEPVIVIRDIHINEEGFTIFTEVFAAPEDLPRVYADLWDGVQSNGDYYPLTWTIEEVEEISSEYTGD